MGHILHIEESGFQAEKQCLPGKLAEYHDLHHGETVIVCGCGASLNELKNPEFFITIGVNDVGRLFDPTYLVVVNPRRQFKSDRFHYVEESRAKAIFTQLDLGLKNHHIVRFTLGKRGGTDFSDPNVLHYTQNSPYVALCLAVHMGAKRIGLIGVDFTDNHFYGKTGRHNLAGQFGKIDMEYKKLAESLKQLGVEVYNLSSQSRLTAFPKASIEDLGINSFGKKQQVPYSYKKKIFFVNYKFLSCGEVFTDGLKNAARDLSLTWEAAYWDDPNLPQKIDHFAPDLLFVVHGRRFTQRWKNRIRKYRSAVWLLDEPYEVDDTCRWSNHFDTVFVNDPNTLQLHKNAHYLPVAYDPHIYKENGGRRNYLVGFIGGYNQTRESYLLQLLDAGLLSYVVGGPWKSSRLSKICLSGNIPAQETAHLYQQTRVVVNIFRDIHHYNRKKVAPYSLNPRIYEALACGALVVSESRPEISEIFSEIPTFNNPKQLVSELRELLSDQFSKTEIISRSRDALSNHTYAVRLGTAMKIALPIAIRAVNQEKPEKNNTSSIVWQKTTRKVNNVGTNIHKASGPTLSCTEAFSSIPARHLIYHVWPVKESSWRLNVEELLKRIDIFNGRRIISVFCDSRSDDPEKVKQLLAGHGCEFLIKSNNSIGEAAAFPALLESVKSTNMNDITFYGHAKGVKYGPNFSNPLRKWIQAMYAVNLDNWIEVKRQLNQFSMTGAFKMRGRFATHKKLGNWHYSGTFFWFRNSEVFSVPYQKVPQFYYGVEAWPGILFSDHETGCLFLDGIRGLAYKDSFWRSTGDSAMSRWKKQVQKVPPPANLVKPAPYDGYEWPRLEQLPQEFDWWIEILLREEVKSLLTIGVADGGVEWHVARKFRERGRNIEIAAVDFTSNAELAKAHEDIRSRFGQEVSFFQGDSTSQSLRAQLKGQYDAVFIDSDHSYSGVSSDFHFALSRNPRVIGLHDIVDSDWHVSAHCCVSRLWAEIKAEHKTAERTNGEWGGIGAAWLM